MSDDISDKRTDLNSIFYSRKSIMGYNAMLNFIISGRGNGKTFDYKRMALDSNCQTIWMRRYANDLPDAEKEFMTDLFREGYYTDRDIKIDCDRLYVDGVVKVYFIGLNVADKKKSIPYPNVNYIVFDEFIKTKQNQSYLPRECELFLDFVETVNRLRIDRPEVRCFFLGNKVSFTNPYFTFFGIRKFTGKRFRKFKDGLIVVENYTNKEFIDLKKKSNFGRLISGTKYGAYAIDNESFTDTDDFIKQRPSQSKLIFNIRYESVELGFWAYDNTLYACRTYNPSVLTFAPRLDLRERETPLKSNDAPITILRDYHEWNKLYFEDNISKDTVYTLLEESFK